MQVLARAVERVRNGNADLARKSWLEVAMPADGTPAAHSPTTENSARLAAGSWATNYTDCPAGGRACCSRLTLKRASGTLRNLHNTLLGVGAFVQGAKTCSAP